MTPKASPLKVNTVKTTNNVVMTPKLYITGITNGNRPLASPISHFLPSLTAITILNLDWSKFVLCSN